MAESSDNIWYVAYGSNLLSQRFYAYLTGGPIPGSGTVQEGSRDATLPVASRPVRIDRPLGFGWSAHRWENGGVCFVDPHRVDPGATFGRAWLITVEQLTDVWSQENGWVVGEQHIDDAVDLDALETDRSLVADEGWYRRLEYLGSFDGAPMVTITCADPPEPNPSGQLYLDVVGRGLIETWDLSPVEAADYLAASVGNSGVVDRETLAAQLTAGPVQ